MSFTIDQLDHVPPLSLSMPYEVMQAYLWIDSICKNTTYKQFSDLINNCDLNSESLKCIMKYFYHFWDFDYSLAFSSLSTKYYYRPQPDENTIINIYNLNRLISRRLKELDGPPFAIYSLVTSGVIAHIRIDSILIRTLEEEERENKNILMAYCTVLDTIKGKLLPTIKSLDVLPDPSKYFDPEPRLQSNIPGAKFQFAYLLGDDRYCPDLRPLLDSLGNPWTRPGKEYIVFLQPYYVCYDSLHIYYNLTTFGLGSCTYNLFPVIDGKVYNPQNEFNVPDSSDVEVFKASIRKYINDILNKNTLVLSNKESDDVINDAKVKCYPSVALNSIKIVYYLSQTTTGKLRLFSSNGSLIEEYVVYNTSEQQNNYIWVDISKYPSGIYFVQLMTGTDISNTKFIILN